MAVINRKLKLREFSLTLLEVDPELLKVVVKIILIRRRFTVMIHTIILSLRILTTSSIYLNLLSKPKMHSLSHSSAWKQLSTQDQRTS